MTSNKITFFPAVVLACFIVGAPLALAHAPGENPSRTDDSPAGRNPGSAIAQGDWESIMEKQLDNVRTLIEQTEKQLSEVKDQATKGWAQSVELTNTIKRLGYDNTQQIETLEKQIQIMDEFIKLSKNADTSPGLLDSVLLKAGETDSDLATFLKTYRQEVMFMEFVKMEQEKLLREEKQIKVLLDSSIGERGNVQADVAAQGALYEQLRTKLEEYKQAQNNLVNIMALLNSDSAAILRYKKEKAASIEDSSGLSKI